MQKTKEKEMKIANPNSLTYQMRYSKWFISSLFNKLKVLLNVGVYTKDYKKREKGKSQSRHPSTNVKALDLYDAAEKRKGYLSKSSKKRRERLKLLGKTHEREYWVDKASLQFSNEFQKGYFLHTGAKINIFPLLYKAIDKKKILKLENIPPNEETLMDFVNRKKEKNEKISGSEVEDFVKPIITLHNLLSPYAFLYYPSRCGEKLFSYSREYFIMKIIDQYLPSLIVLLGDDREERLEDESLALSKSVSLISKLIDDYFLGMKYIRLSQVDGYPWHITRKRLLDAGGIVIGPISLHLGCAFGFHDIYVNYENPENDIATIGGFYDYYRDQSFDQYKRFIPPESEVFKGLVGPVAFYFGAFYGNLRIATSLANEILIKNERGEKHTREDEEKIERIRSIMDTINKQLKCGGKFNDDMERLRKEYTTLGLFGPHIKLEDKFRFEIHFVLPTESAANFDPVPAFEEEGFRLLGQNKRDHGVKTQFAYKFEADSEERVKELFDYLALSAHKKRGGGSTITINVKLKGRSFFMSPYALDNRFPTLNNYLSDIPMTTIVDSNKVEKI